MHTASGRRSFKCSGLLCAVLIFAQTEFSYGQSKPVIGKPSFKAGDTWEYRNYEVASGKLNRTWVETVTEVLSDSIRTRRIDSTGEPPKEADAKIDEMYNWPLFVGKTWSVPILANGKTIGEGKSVVGAWEKISISAGSFEALRVEMAFTRPEGSFRQVIWYSPAARNFVRLYYIDKQGKPSQGTELIRFKLQ